MNNPNSRRAASAADRRFIFRRHLSDLIEGTPWVRDAVGSNKSDVDVVLHPDGTRVTITYYERRPVGSFISRGDGHIGMSLASDEIVPVLLDGVRCRCDTAGKPHSYAFDPDPWCPLRHGQERTEAEWRRVRARTPRGQSAAARMVAEAYSEGGYTLEMTTIEEVHDGEG